MSNAASMLSQTLLNTATPLTFEPYYSTGNNG